MVLDRTGPTEITTYELATGCRWSIASTRAQRWRTGSIWWR